jgi:3-oxoacyl-[acyl-carrier protein] reductase
MNIIYPDLENKTILLTGATRGIGRAIALSLAAQKANVVFNYRKHSELVTSLVQEIEQLDGKATALEFDINDSEKYKAELDSYMKENGPIEGLINNAGISKDSLVMRLKEDDLSNILDTNLKSAIMLTSYLSRNFLKAKNVSVVNVSSVVGLMGNVSQTAYAASKAGLIGFTKSFAKELASRNIRCNAIAPGFIETDMTSELTDKAKEEYFGHIPLKRFGSVEEVSNLVNFLLSNASAYITGEVIKIDGGLYI